MYHFERFYFKVILYTFLFQIYFKVILYTAKFKSLNTAHAANEVK